MAHDNPKTETHWHNQFGQMTALCHGQQSARCPRSSMAVPERRAIEFSTDPTAVLQVAGTADVRCRRRRKHSIVKEDLCQNSSL